MGNPKLTQEELERRVALYMGDEYKVIGKYVGSKMPVDVLHLRCNTVSQIYISQLEHHKSWCVKCRARERYSRAFIQKLKDNYGNEYELVGEYVDSDTPVLIQHKLCGNIDVLLPPTISSKDWAGCTECRDIINSFEKLKAAICALNPNIEISGEFNGTKGRIHCKCLLCEHEWDPFVYNLLKRGNCPQCAKNTWGNAIRGVNDVWTTHPNLAKMLKNPEDGYLYSYGSRHALDFVCPDCGYEFTSSFNELTTRQMRCPRCSDGVSYPEKFMMDMLNQLSVNYTYQYSPEWAGKMSYDFYFDVDGIEYIVEMDGAFHYENGMRVDSDVLTNDKIKNELADKHDITIIRIDCNYIDVMYRFKYIQQNICNSLLSEIMDLSKVDFLHCDLAGQKSLVFEAGRLWDEGYRNIDDIARILHVNKYTVRRYLCVTETYHMSSFCDKDYREFIKEVGYKISAIKGSTPILCTTTNKIYNKASDAIALYGAGVHLCLSSKRNWAGKLEDGTRLMWSRLPDDEIVDIKTRLINEIYKQYKMIKT